MKNFCLLILMLLLPMMASADSSGTCGDNLTWTYVEATNTLTIAGNGELISDRAWSSFRNDVRTVVIQNGVTSILDGTFQNCGSLTSVTIPNSVTSIGNYAFDGCTGLTSVTIGSSVTSIGFRAFNNTPFIDNKADGVIYLGKCLYKYKGTMPENTGIVIKNGTISISPFAFERCSGLTSVTIPNSVTSIGYDAFFNCTGLTSVTIPNSVTSIGERAFTDCRSLTLLKVGSRNTVYDSRNDCNAIIESSTNTLIYGCNNTTIPNSVTSIGNEAFNGCIGLTSITIPNSVTSIGEKAFYYCRGLTSVTIPNSVTSISSGTFSSCYDLTSVTIPNSVTSIGKQAFESCSSLTSVTIPNSVTSIGEQAFTDCRSLISVTIPNSVTSIGSNAFYNTPFINNKADGVIYLGKCLYKYKGTMSLNTKIVIENGTISISPDAFKSCIFLNSVTIPNSVTSIGNYAFDGCTRLTSITIPNSVTSIGSSAFSGCSGLTSITIPDNVTSIGSYAFSGCSGLTSVNIPNSVTSILDGTFSNCSGLTSITIPNSVTSIGSSAFIGCSGLTSVNIPNSVTSIGNYAFRGCSNLTKVKAEKSSPLSITSYTFNNLNIAKVTLYIPKGSKSSYSSADYWKDFGTFKEFPSTDVNGDNTTNVVDVVDIARFVVGTPATTFEEFLADLDGNREVNVADAIVLVNEIAGNTNWAKPSFAPSLAGRDALALYGEGSRLSFQMEGTGDYAAFQFDLWLPTDMDMTQVSLNDVRRQGHQLLYNKVGDGHYRVVALSTAGNVFNGTSGELLSMTLDDFTTDDVHIDNIHFVTARGIDIPFEAIGVSYGNDGVTTDIHSVDPNNTTIQPVYNLNGQRLTAPRKGLNIIGGKKYVVK